MQPQITTKMGNQLVLVILLALITIANAFPLLIPREKRQLFREDIPQHRPLTGATYHLHAGYPHPGRFNENRLQVIPPNPNHPSPPPPELAPNDYPDIDHPASNVHVGPHHHLEILTNDIEAVPISQEHLPGPPNVHAGDRPDSLTNLFPNLNAIWEVDNNEISGQVPSGSYSWNIRS